VRQRNNKNVIFTLLACFMLVVISQCSRIKTIKETTRTTWREKDLNQDANHFDILDLFELEGSGTAVIVDSDTVMLTVPKTVRKEGKASVSIVDPDAPKAQTDLDISYAITADSGRLELELADIHIKASQKETTVTVTETVEKRFYEKPFFIAIGAAGVLVIVVGVILFILFKVRKI